jgi:hypothetical protein
MVGVFHFTIGVITDMVRWQVGHEIRQGGVYGTPGGDLDMLQEQMCKTIWPGKEAYTLLVEK